MTHPHNERGVSTSSRSSSNSSRTAATSNIAPELLVWRRLRSGSLPQPLAQSAQEDENRRKDEGRTDAAWAGVLDGREGIRKGKQEAPSRHSEPESNFGLQRVQTWVPLDQRLPWRERIRHFTWTWFAMTMATGGIANVLWAVPIRFQALYALGCIFFILNMVLFLFNVTMISLRFYFYPEAFKSSFIHPTESLFIPAAVISIGTIFINISQYGVGSKTGPWLDHTMTALFWIYCALAVGFSSAIYLVMWSTQTFTISQMTPIWIFPAYPLLIVGPHASVLSTKISPDRALNVLIGGFTLQGIGFMVSLMIYAAYLYRLMTQKLPKESLRPGMFISVGPSGFTISAIIGMAHQLPNVISPTFMGDGELTAKVTLILGNWVGIWLWGLALWFFIVSVGAHTSCVWYGTLTFSMTWYSFVFPNTALTTATFAVARALDANYPIEMLGVVFACLLVVAWVLVFSMMIRAVVLKHILWPQMQENRDEGGFRQTQVDTRNIPSDRESNSIPRGRRSSEATGRFRRDLRKVVEEGLSDEKAVEDVEIPPFTRPATPEVEPVNPDIAGAILAPTKSAESRSNRNKVSFDPN